MYIVFNVLCSASALLTILAFSLSDFDAIIRYNIFDHILWAFWTVIFFMLSIFFFVLGRVLKKVAQDAEDDLASLTRQVKELQEVVEGPKSLFKKSYSER